MAPPDFICFRPLQIFTLEISLYQLGIEHILIISFSCVTCIRFFFAKPRGGDIVHRKFKNVSTIPGCPVLFRPPPRLSHVPPPLNIHDTHTF